VSFEFPDTAAITDAFQGRRPAHTYSRITNPTVENLEMRIARIAGVEGVVAVSSGMAAITNVVLCLAGAGDSIVTTRRLFGNTLSLFEKTLGRWGLDVRYVDMTDTHQLSRAIDTRTRLVFLESITNPHLEVADIAAVCRAAGEQGVPVVLDGTLTTPYLLPSRELGVAVEIISSTKFISGGATGVGGLILDNGVFDWSKNPWLRDIAPRFGPYALLKRLRSEVYRNTGGALSPHNAWLQILGLETMALRVDRICENALSVARFLEKRLGPAGVNYPGLESSPSFDVASRQFHRGCGGLCTFFVQGRAAAARFMDALDMVRRSTNLNDNKTLILHPASTIFCEYPEEVRKEMGVTEGMLRLSVGIEDVEDIIEDLERGFAAV
jgi:O-acetylhomoserine (thiol)-lyase